MEIAQQSLLLVVLLVGLVLCFSFINGFHDAANSVATIVSTGVLKPGQAVILAACFNFLAIFIFHLTVAETVGRGIVDPAAIDHYVVFGALIAAIGWNLVTWYQGIPSSSSHALLGGILGAALAKAGTTPLIWDGVIKTLAFILLSPLLGFFLASLLMLAMSWLAVGRSPMRVDNWFRRLQLASAAAYSIGHGGNDAQKAIGILWLLLLTTGYAHTGDALPGWVSVICYAAIALGTLFGGWRIVRTLGQGITRLKPIGGFCAETGGALSLFIAAMLGIPVSTTHTITGAIVGVGSSQRFSAVRWGLAGRILWIWICTIPACALISALAWWLAQQLR
ncbi:MAG: anion permease [Candidatus Dactylopiibacterium carminicum]|uniref:Anion permease n=1 Tax=Candidatus Dactylopiibacterium carminicum TaxID=857335 RepID=A0A272EV01_9RHOO|nr:inorganic phosphate transporter [Candidatus Dactylopiibacterium carminicum]KAF7599813.1 inorganic phosphate transporter [Candidatus Dactylopiibacterium carminicum]PAS93924.1 MAG: anion permease [Candidatus Dactylopiibacterium carminicum]PAS97239.1 MAG: anion permease [Candidatus Dactylopiibacterium carminicum]PAS99815.1 MAG: anion permease [Candidatus Dactylopiibacterium carminicum]